MKKTILSLAAAAALAAASAAQAAETSNLNVKVELAVSACSISLDKDSIDLGTLKWVDMKDTGFNVLPGARVKVSVTCSGDRTFAMRMDSGSTDPALAGAAEAALAGTADSEAFAMPINGEGSHGAYVFQLTDATADNAGVTFIGNATADVDAVWTATDKLAPNTYVAVAGDDQLPKRVSELVAYMQVRAALAGREKLDPATLESISNRVVLSLKMI